MPKTPLLVIASLLTLTAATPYAFAKAKIIHVPDVLNAAPVPNPPAGEDEAAGLRGRAEGLPKVLRLQRAVKVVVPQPASPEPGSAIADCAVPGAATTQAANPFYAPADLIYGSRIAFPTPAWDSARFLPTAGWSGQPGIWASHVR